MKVVFMGTPEFAVPTLNRLIEEGHEILGVYTKTDKAKGRGNKIEISPVKREALKHNINIYQPSSLKGDEVYNELKAMSPDVIVVIAYGQILTKKILDIPPYGCINVHGSLLPKYRGAAPIQWAILNGEEVTGITTMYMDAGIDTGDMILKAVIPIESIDTGGSLHDKLSIVGANLLIDTLKQLEDNTAIRIKQDDSLSNYAKMLDKSLGRINWKEKAVDIERKVRGLNPWPSAYTLLEEKTLKIWSTDVISEEFSGTEGEIVILTKDQLFIKTGENTLSIKELQLEGKKRMNTADFLRGVSLKEGMIFN